MKIFPSWLPTFCADRRNGCRCDPCELDPAAVELLCEYYWPGNVRELENIVSRASVLNVGGPITADELRNLAQSPQPADAIRSNKSTSADGHAAESIPPGLSLEAMERKLIEATLDHFDGHRAKTAQALGIGLRTLSGKLKQYGYAPRAKVFAKAELTNRFDRAVSAASMRPNLPVE